MIKNEKQYRITKAQGRRFEEAVAELARQERPANITPRLWQAQRAAAASQWQELQEQIDAYERLSIGGNGGKSKELVLEAVEDLPKTLIRARPSGRVRVDGLRREVVPLVSARKIITLLAKDLPSVPPSYAAFRSSVKERIRSAQVRAAVAVNQELMILYWGIGKEILARQQEDGWGTRVIERLAKDLRSEFPDMQGLSPRNLGYMKAFAEAWPEEVILQELVAKLPWGHNVRLFDLVKQPEERTWYVQQAIQSGRSRNVLVMQVESGLYRRQGKALTNFQATLPKPQSDLAQQLIKDPYSFDFLALTEEAHERDLERGLLAHLRQFLVELGVGFAFVGSQVPLEVGGEDFKIDLLFYHLKLRCFVVIDLKMGAFKPEYARKMNFYLSAVDDMSWCQ